MSCLSTNSPVHRMCNNCKKWRDLDWSCVMCGYKNFAKRDTCKECGAGHVPEFNKEEGNYSNYSNSNVYQEVQEETGFQGSFSSASQQMTVQAPLEITVQTPAPDALEGHYQAPVEAPFQSMGPQTEEIPWMCGMCNTENTPKRILCFECSGHRERVEVRNRAAESRMSGGLGVVPPPAQTRFSPAIRDGPRLHQGGMMGDPTLDWLCFVCNNNNQHHRRKCNVCLRPRNEVEAQFPRETPPWVSMNQPHIRDHPRGGEPMMPVQTRPEDRTKDWACSECGNRNFAKRKECNRCKKPREEVEDKSIDYSSEEPPALKRSPEPMPRINIKAPRVNLMHSVNPPPLPQRPEDVSNDWVCGKCNINCFAKKTNCFRCGKPRSEVETKDVDIRKFERPMGSYPAPPQRQSRPPQQIHLPGHDLRINSNNWNNDRRLDSSWNSPRNPPPPPQQEKQRKKWVDEDKSNDWNCKLCKINNFAKRKTCFSCKKSRDECEEEKTKDVVKESPEVESEGCEAES
ncbi:hypothetical protein ACHWQZ_G013379 [Mnemiopsis leidyi]